jgi:hypothetical protein
MAARRKLAAAGLVMALAAGVACSRSTPAARVYIPPRIDLARWGTLGMLEFSAPAAEPLGALASREFLSAIHAAQPGTPVLELGSQPRVIAALGGSALDPAMIRAIGEKYRVDALIVGELATESVEPSLAFDSAAQWVSATAELEAALSARIFETRSGATIWTTAARAREQIARVDLSSLGVSGVGANRTDDARLRLVRSLAASATSDFRAYWE